MGIESQNEMYREKVLELGVRNWVLVWFSATVRVCCACAHQQFDQQLDQYSQPTAAINRSLQDYTKVFIFNATNLVRKIVRVPQSGEGGGGDSNLGRLNENVVKHQIWYPSTFH